ncbi:MAG: cupin domain-containing protein [Deltaproteobacteria bacterium]|nr:cupin domain-containing protein [Deltaproteobacteria bacterium]
MAERANAPVKRVEKPWGHEIIWAHTERYVGKVLHIKAGHALSLQYHQKKDETVHVWSGQMKFQSGEGEELSERILNPGDSFHITPHLRHRMIAVTDCDILEASTPELDDVVRLEDRYGRKGT